jgi:hypothetical protein
LKAVESLRLDFHVVGAVIQAREVEESGPVACYGARFAGGDVGDGDFGVGDNSACGIGDGTAQFSIFLRSSHRDTQEYSQDQTKHRFGKLHVILQKLIHR